MFFFVSDGEFKEVYRGEEYQHTFTGLSPGHSYRIRLAAVSEGGTSEVSKPSPPPLIKLQDSTYIM